MTVLGQLSREWLAWIGAASWQLAVLVGIVAVLVWVARTAPARLRHGLWLLVLVKAFLPPFFAVPCSVAYWTVGPLLDNAGLADVTVERIFYPSRPSDERIAEKGEESKPTTSLAGRTTSVPTMLMMVWAGGCVLFWGFVVWRYAAVARATRTAPSLDEGPLRVALEQIAMNLRLRRVPDLLTAERVASPFLFGVIRPRIVLPKGLVESLG